jgi:hypothetical protein
VLGRQQHQRHPVRVADARHTTSSRIGHLALSDLARYGSGREWTVAAIITAVVSEYLYCTTLGRDLLRANVEGSS